MTSASSQDVDRSTLRLSDVARHVVVPDGIDRSLWLGWDGQEGVEARVAEFGFTFDRWQDGLAQIVLGVTALGHFAATVGGIILSIPRQVAKTFMTMVIVLALCSMFPNLTALWTAHRARLSTQTFRKMKSLARSKALSKYVLPGAEGVRSTNGEQEIHFRNGSVIMFGARERGFGLGFDEVDIEVFDEAQRLTSTAIDDMVAATNQSRWKFGALLFFMGTPPRPSDEGEEFTNRRAKALAVKASVGVGDFGGVVVGGEAVFVECSADSRTGRPGGPHINDREQVKIANPSYPHRTPEISVQRLREQLTNDDSWRREGLGIWDEAPGASRLITAAEWTATGVAEVPEAGVRAVGVAFSLNGERMSVAGALKHDGVVHGEVVDGQSGDLEAGIASLADWLAERWRSVAMIAISGQAGSAALAQALRDRGVPGRVIHVLSGPEVFAANSMYYDGIRDKTITHPIGVESDHLERAVAVCDKEKVSKTSSAWRWRSTTADGDETPLEAVGFASWAVRTVKAKTGKAVFA